MPSQFSIHSYNQISFMSCPDFPFPCCLHCQSMRYTSNLSYIQLLSSTFLCVRPLQYLFGYFQLDLSLKLISKLTMLTLLLIVSVWFPIVLSRMSAILSYNHSKLL